jgi:O-phosphoseryl-tRNA synthetase
MVKINVRKLVKHSLRDFEGAWTESAKALPRNTSVPIPKRGQTHPFRDMVQKCRESMVKLGFTEIENRTLLPAQDVYRQYGPEAPVILDRAFYIAKLPRPELGLGKERITNAEQIIGSFDVEIMQELLRDYKKGHIEGDDFIEKLVTDLDIRTDQATKLISDVFPEFMSLKPEPTDLTLRTHMSATWYHTLAEMQNKTNYPLALFAVGPRYRNEQKEDKGHLRVHHSASFVVMDPRESLEAGREQTLEFLVDMGFPDVEFEKKKSTSKYYANEQEEEIFVKWRGEWLEIGNIGMYSPVSLANFNIRYPVFNAGFGVERLALIVNGYDDIRELMFPQFYSSEFDDGSIAERITQVMQPTTARGQKIAEGIESIAREQSSASAPCEFIAYEDEEVIVKVTEQEQGKSLVGPAIFNEVYVEDGNILSYIDGYHDNSLFSYINSISQEFAAKIEKCFAQGNQKGKLQCKMVRSLRDINLNIPLQVQNYITGSHKKINIGGPVFLTVEYWRKNDET